jgi:hypothetical protein
MHSSHDAGRRSDQVSTPSRRAILQLAAAGLAIATIGEVAGRGAAPAQAAAPAGFNYPFTDETDHGPVPYIDMDDLFGSTRGRVNPHSGIDLWAPYIDGRSIRSIAPGSVISVVVGEGGYGDHVQVQHPTGHVSLYAHMKQGTIAVAVGNTVAAGQHLGGVGNTGDSTGSHLHLTMYANRGGPLIDPLPFVLGAPFANRINQPGEDPRVTRGFAVYANSATNAWVIGGPGTWREVPAGKGELYQSIYGERVALSNGDFLDVAATCLKAAYGDVRLYANTATNAWVLAGPGVWFLLTEQNSGFFRNLFGERVAVNDSEFRELRAAFGS